jgi:hypothetical protein
MSPVNWSPVNWSPVARNKRRLSSNMGYPGRRRVLSPQERLPPSRLSPRRPHQRLRFRRSSRPNYHTNLDHTSRRHTPDTRNCCRNCSQYNCSRYCFRYCSQSGGYSPRSNFTQTFDGYSPHSHFAHSYAHCPSSRSVPWLRQAALPLRHRERPAGVDQPFDLVQGS